MTYENLKSEEISCRRQLNATKEIEDLILDVGSYFSVLPGKVLEGKGAIRDIAIYFTFEEHEGPIRLLLTDVVMPIISGRDLVKGLLEIQPELKVLYMSGYTNDTITQHDILNKGANYIQKPFTVDGLAREVREVLDK